MKVWSENKKFAKVCEWKIKKEVMSVTLAMMCLLATQKKFEATMFAEQEIKLTLTNRWNWDQLRMRFVEAIKIHCGFTG